MHDREHVISIVLNHEDWQEFVKLQPDPSNWLHERIQEIIAASRPEQETATSAPAAAGIA